MVLKNKRSSRIMWITKRSFKVESYKVHKANTGVAFGHSCVLCPYLPYNFLLYELYNFYNYLIASDNEYIGRRIADTSTPTPTPRLTIIAGSIRPIILSIAVSSSRR